MNGCISMVDDLCHSYTGYNMHPHNSSSYSGRMLTNEPGSNGIAKFGVSLLSELSVSPNHHGTCVQTSDMLQCIISYLLLTQGIILQHFLQCRQTRMMVSKCYMFANSTFFLT